MIARFTALFAVGVAVLNGAHPVLHLVEEGSMDAVLGYLNAVAAQLTQGAPRGH